MISTSNPQEVINISDDDDEEEEKKDNTWQLDPSQFKLTNPKWTQLVQKLVDENVKKGLGLPPEVSIIASLYKLLFYEKDSHFNFHKDTEKEDGMFATLVIQLPCFYTGGELIVQQNSREHVYDFQKNSQFNAFYGSFYADCKHSVKPITSGYRLCLIYNILCKQRNRHLAASQQGNTVQQLRDEFTRWNNGEYQDTKIMYILEHEYTMAGLSFDVLKGNDEAIVSMITNANRDEKLIDCALGIVQKTESGSASCSSYSYYGGGDYEMEDVFDVTLSLTHCVGMDNKEKHDLTSIEIHDNEIFPRDVWDTLEADDESVEEATGKYLWISFLRVPSIIVE